MRSGAASMSAARLPSGWKSWLAKVEGFIAPGFLLRWMVAQQYNRPARLLIAI
jgi:hypothetical protein